MSDDALEFFIGISEKQLQIMEEIAKAAQRLMEVQKGTMAYYGAAGQALVAALAKLDTE